ncbi:DUF3783 domain-containing protein [uncultured Clostridium sp.]|uniref:DUF3783 domain-containing protein n=1 Tax=uncultured Clostridium sp. TaxID=59620 RepID=UPI0026208E71|nr:DUF3783 domain-containing protein [uncultured Clostridium sp.]
MLENKKCILAYGLDVVELMKLQQAKVKIIRVTEDMGKVLVKDILAGSTDKIASDKLPKNEKFVIFNNLSNMQMELAMALTTRILKKKPVLATVTETSLDWEFEYLIEHLLEEREWHKTNKGSAMRHEQE